VRCAYTNLAIFVTGGLLFAGACRRLPPASTSGVDSSGQVVQRPVDASCDLSTDDAVQKRAADKSWGASCIARAASFPGLVQIGDAVPDRGCVYSHMLYGCEADDPGIPATAMAAAGWSHADAAHRQRLALDWLEQVTHAGWGQVLETEPDPADDGFTKMGKPFTPPTVVASSAGGVELRYWILLGGGMIRGSIYNQLDASFAADGTTTRPKTIDSFTWIPK
jgi:hypothetical protein